MMIVKSRFRYYPILLCMMVPILILIACNPTEYYAPYGVVYCSPVDSAWKAIVNLEISYNESDLNAYLSCFSSDFEFYYESDEDTLNWDLNSEQDIHQSMFIHVSEICLGLSGSEEYTWSGDTTGAKLVLPRHYGLKVYMDPAHTISYTAYGTAHFICRQDSTGEWYVWQWWDYPNPGEEGWSDIKLLFSK